MNVSKKLFPLTQTVVRGTRQASNLTEVPSPRYAKMKKNQEKFGVDDSVPVHLKGGYGDRVLAISTIAGVLVGTGLALHTFYTLAFKR
ncbi:cytochrome c oxidase subunit 7A2, mitochondrial-like [Euwallacea similis]|uniref:cytochrome c oxidase subunit 7A2, mitochondrial-like n=1 Tax=Euwallacea similis TaxID=1736056 RepID=UPI00344F68AC